MSSKKKSKTKTIVWSIVAVVIIAAVVLAVAMRPTTSNYDQVQAKTGDISTYYSFPGTIAAINSQVLYADKTMQIKTIDVTAGQMVKSGDVLMTTTMGENITAPFDGEVTDVYAALNAEQMPGDKLCRVVDYNDLQLDVQVDEYDLSAIAVGKDTTIMINALNKNVDGKVTEIDQEGVSQNGVTYFNATVSLPVESDLRVGMTAQATMLNQSVQNVTTLPMSAIQFDDTNASFVYMKGKKKIPDQVSVTLGINDGTTVQIISGVKSGDTVLVPPVAKTTGFGAARSSSTSTQNSGTGNQSNTSGSVTSSGGNG